MQRLAETGQNFHIVRLYLLAKTRKVQLVVVGSDRLRSGYHILDTLVIGSGCCIESKGSNLWTKERNLAWERSPGPGSVGNG